MSSTDLGIIKGTIITLDSVHCTLYSHGVQIIYVQIITLTECYYSPSMFVVVPVVHSCICRHDVGHLLQQDSVVALDSGKPLLLHLHLLQFEMQVHVRLWGLVINHRLCIPDLH